MGFLCLWCFCGLISAAIGSQRESPVLGFLLGFFLGPIGIVLAFLVDNRPTCPFCAERHRTGAVLCPHCRTSLVPRRREAQVDPEDWQNQHVDRRPTSHPGPAAVDENAFDAFVDESLGEKPAQRRSDL